MRKSRIVTFSVTVLALLTMVFAFYGDVQKNMNLGLDLQGGFEIVYEVSPLEGETLPEMSAVAASVSKRIDVLGVNEPEIIIEGDNRIRVQLAGVKDIEQARRVISSTANLTFRDVKDKLLMDATVLVEGGATLAFQDGKPVVSLKIKDKDKFFEVTKKVSEMPSGNNLMVTWLDWEEGESYNTEKTSDNPAFISAASVTQGINGDAIISGGFSEDEARELASLINSGSLPVKMTEIYSNVVSADYGTEAFAQTMFAGVIGVILVMAFMILYYRIPGVIASIALAVYVFLVMYAYNLMGGVYTLSGIAALVLGVGMTIDASVITFERIKDSLLQGRSVKSAFKEGNQKAFSTIFDSQLTTFISALILYVLGTGSVKGFAAMLMVTVFATLTLSVWLVKFLLGQLVESGWLDNKKAWLGVQAKHIPNLAKGEEQFYFGPLPKFDFVKASKKLIAVSIGIIVVAVVFMGINGFSGKGALNLGIDFASGTKITIQSDETISQEEVVALFEKYNLKPTGFKYAGDNEEILSVTVKEAVSTETMAPLKAEIEEMYGYEANDSVVTPVVGRELVKNAFLISILSWIAILIYISIRFKWDYAVSAIVALFHDVAIVIAVFAIFRFEVNTELIAVILAIIGYSIDDSIVIFDRIRETVADFGKKQIRDKDYVHIVNDSLQKMVMRSLVNTATTVIPVGALLLLGSEAIFTFNFAMFIGLIAGAYSSLFVAAQLWLWLRLNYKPKAKTKNKIKDDELHELVIPGIND
ncbi:MAG: protein translocase subunit SecD [Erysipelotrichaceae bacterium]